MLHLEPHHRGAGAHYIYMKVIPKAMFWGQIFATVIASTMQLGV